MKIRNKLLLSFSFFIIPFLLLGILASIVIEKQAIDHALLHAELYAKTFTLTIERETRIDRTSQLFFQREDLEDYINDIYLFQKIDIVVVDTAGIIIADIIKSKIGDKYNLDKNNEVLLSIRDGLDRNFKVVNDEYPDGKFLYVHRIEVENGQILGAVLIDYSTILKESRAENSFVRKIILYATLFFIFISIVFGFILSKKIKNPISNLIDAARKFSHGDYSVRVKSERKDELGELENAFNQMIEQKEKADEQVLLLSNTLKSTNDIIAIADVNFNFLFANNAFCKTFGYTQEELIGQFVGSVLLEQDDITGGQINRS